MDGDRRGSPLLCKHRPIKRSHDTYLRSLARRVSDAKLSLIALLPCFSMDSSQTPAPTR